MKTFNNSLSVEAISEFTVYRENNSFYFEPLCFNTNSSFTIYCETESGIVNGDCFLMKVTIEDYDGIFDIEPYMDAVKEYFSIYNQNVKIAVE